MDDPRFDWLRKQINLALDINDDEIFAELIGSDNKEVDLKLFLSQSHPGLQARGADGEHYTSVTVFFYKKAIQEEVAEEIEVPICEWKASFSDSIDQFAQF